MSIGCKQILAIVFVTTNTHSTELDSLKIQQTQSTYLSTYLATKHILGVKAGDGLLPGLDEFPTGSKGIGFFDGYTRREGLGTAGDSLGRLYKVYMIYLRHNNASKPNLEARRAYIEGL